MHVPMIMNWPGVIPKGTGDSARSAATWTCCPRSAKAAGAALPARPHDGWQSTRCRWRPSGRTSTHDAIFWSSGGQLAVRRGKWKLVKDGKLFDGTPRRR